MKNELNKSVYNDRAIPIVLSADDNYAMPLCVTMVSILENKKTKNLYDFYILTPSQFKEKNKNKIMSLENKYRNCKITFIDMKDKLSDAPKNLAHVTNPTYYRLLISEILPSNYNKALYFDVDIVVDIDLQEMFDIDIKDNYVAGVLHPAYYFTDVNHPFFRNILNLGGMKDYSQYINAGVLLLNLDKIRKDRLDKIFIELVAKSFPTVDQDVINTACYGKILHIPFKYDVMPKCSSFLHDKRINEIYNPEEFMDAFKNPSIIHWANPEKPWTFEGLMFCEYWFKYFKLSPFKNIRLEVTQKRRKRIINKITSHFKPLLKVFGIIKRNKPKISVILPVYNVEKYLQECLDSIINQTLKDIEIICINDGSTDSSLKILKEYAKKDKRIIIVNQKNKGAAISRNKGIDIAKGEYFSILDSDDFFDPAMLEKMYNKADKNSADIVICQSRIFDEKTREYKPFNPILTDAPKEKKFCYKDMPNLIFNFTVGWAWDKLYKASFVKENKLYFQNLRSSNDFFFVYLSLIKAKSIIIFDDALISHRKNTQTSLSETRTEDPLCFIKAIRELRKGILETGIYNEVEQSYLNFVLMISFWHYRTFPEETRDKVYKKLRSMFKSLGLFDLPEDYFYKFDYSDYNANNYENLTFIKNNISYKSKT